MIVVNGLTVRDNTDRRILDSVDLRVDEGSVHALVGESGSGKTTLALSLLGRVRPGLSIVSGKVSVGGTDPATLSARALRSFRRTTVSWLAQDPWLSLTPHLTVRDLLTETSPGAVSDHDILAVLETVGLDHGPGILTRRPNQLSGGQRRRVAIARAIASRPRLLILDEPTAGLDPQAISDVMSSIESLRTGHGLTILMVSHDLDAVARVADIASTIVNGTVIESGDVQTLLEKPTSELSAASAKASLRNHTKPDVTRVAESNKAATQIPPALRLADLSVDTAAGDRIIEGLNFFLTRGEAVAIVGPSGIGKSTLVRTVMGAVAPAAGHIEIDGVLVCSTLEDRAPTVRRRMQLIGQDPAGSLNPSLSVGRQLTRAVRRTHRYASRREVLSRVAELLDHVNLAPELLRQKPHRLSGGQAQRVAIARALAHEPTVLLCDETTSALDPSVQRTVLELLDQLRREHDLALMVVTHDARVANFLCSRQLNLGDDAKITVLAGQQ